jgi:tetratricopeptide (TPR) repeat protein
VESYLALAEVYRKQGQLDRWQATLEDFLKEPSWGLDHARVRQAIVEHFIERRQWDKALPYAKDAADTGAGWAMQALANVYEGLQRFDECEEITRAMGDRYPTAEYRWLYFCKRVGTGDLDAAREAAKRYINTRNRPLEVDVVATVLELGGNLEKAFEIHESEFQETKNPYSGVAAALLADRLRKTEKRDGLLKQVRREGHDFKRPGTGKIRRELIELAEIIAADLAAGGKGQIDYKRAHTIRDQADAGEQMCFNYFLGRYLDNRGHKEKAIEYWRQVMLYVKSMTESNRTLAGAALIERGVNPEDYREEMQTPVKAGANESGD